MDELTKTDRHHLLSECKKTLVGCDETLGRVAWDWGNALKQVQVLELWRDDGATSFSAWLEKELTISRTSALRAIALCVHFTPEMAGRYGGRKLTAALIYLELTGKIEKPGDLQGIDIRVRGPKGTFVTVPFSKASGPQIEEANAILREAEAARIDKQKAKEIEQSVHDEAKELESLLPPAPPKTFRGKKRVIPVKAADGTVAFTIHGVPQTTMRAFQAWLKAKPQDVEGGP